MGRVVIDYRGFAIRPMVAPDGGMLEVEHAAHDGSRHQRYGYQICSLCPSGWRVWRDVQFATIEDAKDGVDCLIGLQLWYVPVDEEVSIRRFSCVWAASAHQRRIRRWARAVSIGWETDAEEIEYAPPSGDAPRVDGAAP
jgi:hypothetical protein